MVAISFVQIVFLQILLASGIACFVKAGEPPNVVLIFADDLGYGDVGCYGATKVKTPNIDRLAKEGRRFTDVHSASAVCTPSRYGLLTGQYPVRAMGGKGSWGPLPIDHELIIDPKQTTIGKLFQNKGYATACFGKWHLGFKKGKNDWQVPISPGPQDVGFDQYFGLGVVNSAPPYVYMENESFLGYDESDPLVYFGRQKNRKGTPTKTFPKEASVKSPNRFDGAIEAHKIYDDEKTGTLLTEKAIQFIGANKEKPFFLYFPTPNIHHPCTPAAEFKGTSDCGPYGDYIHELDWIVGEILESLDEHGLSDNTLVIFTSDNGGIMNLAGRNAVKAGHKMNGDLLGFKFGVWEGGHRVPFIARWPGKVPAGTKSDQLIGLIDMFATFTALTGQDSALTKGTDSINMLPALIENPTEPLRTELLLAAHSKKHFSLRKGKWMYIPAKGSGGFRGSKPQQHAWGGPPATALVGSVNSDIENGKLKKDSPLGQLYDLENDPTQTRNVFNEYPEVVKQMEAKLKTWRPKKAAGSKKQEPKKKAA
jgi:arylsulfatase A-like enzyme